jgi:hypothetical protein
MHDKISSFFWGLRYSLPVLLLCTLFLPACRAQEPAARKTIDAAKIQKMLDKGRPVDLDNYLIVGDLDLSKVGTTLQVGAGRSVAYLSSPISFRNCSFKGKVHTGERDSKTLHSVVFEKHLFFEQCRFEEEVDLRWIQVRGMSGLARCVFAKKARFDNARFEQTLQAYDCVFTDEAYWQQVEFLGGAQFLNSQWGNTAYFQGALFNRDAQFGASEFAGYADFSLCQFRAGAFYNYAVFHNRSVFNNSVFMGRCEFQQAKTFQNAEWKHCEFRGGLKASQLRVERGLTMEGSSFRGERPNRTDIDLGDGAKLFLGGQ